MLLRRLANGDLLVPTRAEGAGGEVGDVVLRLSPGDVGYAEAAAAVDHDERIAAILKRGGKAADA